MHVRPCRPSSGSDLGYGVAARHPVTHLDKILIIVAVQHFTAVVGFNNNSKAVDVRNHIEMLRLPYEIETGEIVTSRPIVTVPVLSFTTTFAFVSTLPLRPPT